MSLLQRRLQQIRNQEVSEQTQNPIPMNISKQARWLQVKDRVQEDIVTGINTELLDKIPAVDRSNYVKQQIKELVDKVLAEMEISLTRAEIQQVVDTLDDEITGYGPITPLLADNTVNEIMVNGAKHVYVERKGKLERTDFVFRDDNHLLNIIERIVSPLGKRIDENSPMVDARLPDGSRVNATIPPVALNGPVLTIRKFSATPLSIGDLINFGTLSSNMAVFLKDCVKGRLNVLIGGGTASGKTTTLNVLSSFIPNDERIVTIEDAAELHLQQEHVVRLESRPPNIEGRGQIKIRDLVINALRMRPDRIVVGEVRGGEALDMLQAMNTGHDGSLTTGHANSPRDLLARLESMVLMSGVELPLKAIREQVVSAVDLIVFQERLRDGKRKITRITEVVGMEGDVITLQDIFLYDQQGVDENGKVIGCFRASGVLPKCLSTLEAKGIHVPISIFA